MKAIFLALSLLIATYTAAGQSIPTIRLVPFISSGLSSSVFMTPANDGTNRLFIVQQGGTIRVLQPGASSTTEFLNITTRVSSGGERGLLGLAFHPQYTSNRRFFVYYTRQPDGAIQIAEYQTSVNDPNVAVTTEKIIITIPHPTNTNHNGGTVAFGPDGYLYAGPGDGGGGNDGPNNAQNINQLLGKILRLDINNVPDGQVPAYNIPPDNPYTGRDGADEIYAIGMRNPYRFSFDRGTGQLWAADVGQSSWEEVDLIINGGNYGWRIMEGNHCNPAFNGGVCTPPAGHIPPIFEYSSASPSQRCSITGGFVYRGTLGSLPTGSYLYGDYCTGEILLWYNNAQTLLLDTSRFIVGFAEDEAGELYVIGQSGTIEKIALVQVSISGRVFTPGGLALRNATVILTDEQGVQRIATTSSFGNYQFDGVAAGRTYTLSVASRRYRFAPKIQAVNADITDLDFVGME